MQFQSIKDILVVKDLRKEVHNSMQIIVQTRWVIIRTRGCTVSGLASQRESYKNYVTLTMHTRDPNDKSITTSRGHSSLHWQMLLSNSS